MTCNPNWFEIEKELLPNEEAQNRPDLLTRIFRSKFEHLKKEVIQKKLFGPVAAFTYEKRGLPHIHLLLTLQQRHKLMSPESFDSFISAELPDPIKYPHLHSMVVKHMMHEPCGFLNKTNVCMKNGSCKNHYPKGFAPMTTIAMDRYPIYTRCNNGAK